MSSAKGVLFVCTGNTCRSPMAESIFSVLVPGTSAFSAGIHADPGMPMSKGAADALAGKGIKSTPHTARRVDVAMIAEAEAVYVMERAHKEALLARFPEASGKTFVLREAAGLSPADVQDPVGAGPEEYRACASSIEEALQIVARRHSHANPR